MKKGNPEPLTPELQAELEALAAMPDSEIDATEMPPITDWSHAVRGPFYPPRNRLTPPQGLQIISLPARTMEK